MATCLDNDGGCPERDARTQTDSRDKGGDGLGQERGGYFHGMAVVVCVFVCVRGRGFCVWRVWVY